MSDLDLGARCNSHTGEAFQPRCPACESLNREYQTLGIVGGEAHD